MTQLPPATTSLSSRGVTVQSTGAAVQLAAGDDVTVQAGATIQSPSSLLAFVNSGSADGGVGGTFNLNGTLVATDTSIVGSVDNDTLNGTPLVDSFNGSTGADTMTGGAASDFYFVDNAGDAVIERPARAPIPCSPPINYGLTANVENLGAARHRRPAGLRQHARQYDFRQ